MQSTSTMPGMSPAKDLFRRFSNCGYSPRKGQSALIQYVSDHPDQPVYSGVLPTGYGKSDLFLSIVDILKQQLRVNRILAIVPTDTQRRQYAEGIKDSIKELQLNINSKNIVVCSGEEYMVRAHKENLAEIYITTVQSIVAGTDKYIDLTKSGKWLIFCDEFHKLNVDEKAKWGKAVDAITHTVTLGMTATPVRSDGKDTYFAGHQPDVEVSFEDAFEEESIRGVKAHIEHYFVDVINDDGSVDRLTTENINDYDLSKDLRLTAKYQASLLSSAESCLTQKNLTQPGQHQMLVFAMNVQHATMISNVMNTIAGAGFSEWVGVGPHGRKSPENTAILDRYKDNQIRCLVQVDIAGEGFDNPRSSVLVFLHLLRKATVKAVQQAGRGIRRNYDIKEFDNDVCDMFASPDTEMSELAVEMANRTLGQFEADEKDVDSTKARETPIYDIPPFDPQVSDSEYDRSEIIAKIPQRDVDMFRQKVGDAYGTDRAGDITEDMLLNVLAQDRINMIEKAAKENGLSNRQKVTEAVSMLVSNISRLRFGRSLPSGMAGDLKTSIHGQWVRKTGLKSGAMTDDEFRTKYDWVSGINEELKSTREIPAWLQL